MYPPVRENESSGSVCKVTRTSPAFGGRHCGFCVDQPKMTNANNQQMLTELPANNIDTFYISHSILLVQQHF